MTQTQQPQSAQERLAELFTRMAPRRTVLLGVLDMCRTGRNAGEVAAYVDEAQQTNHSVYSAGTILSLLEEAGGIERVTCDGTAYSSEPVEPEHVVVDGVEYLRAATPQALYWQTSEAGLEILEQDRPLERVEDLFSCDAHYLPVYKTVLELCSQSEGANAAQLGKAVDKLELVQEPRFFAAHFVERLERAGAVEWRDVWVATEVGMQALDMLADVQAA